RWQCLPACKSPSGKQQRRKAATAIERRLVGRTPGLEELHQLLAGLVILPTAVQPENVKKQVGGVLALVLGVQEQGELEAGVVVLRILFDPGAQFTFLAEVGRLVGKRDLG